MMIKKFDLWFQKSISVKKQGFSVDGSKSKILKGYLKPDLAIDNLFGGQGNSKRRCWYMHFKSSLEPYP